MSKPVKVRDYEESTLLNDDDPFDAHVHFYSGIPRENAVDNSRLAERSLLQGAQSGLLHDRVSVNAEKDEF